MNKSKSESPAVIQSASQAWPYIKWLTRSSPNQEEDASDLFQDTVTALLRRWRQRGTVPNTKYAKLTARSQFYSAHRKERLRRDCEKARSVSDEDRSRWAHNHGASVLESIVSASDQKLLTSALDMASGMDRQVIELYSQGKKRRELASLLSLSRRGADSRLRRAVLRLREAVKSIHPGPSEK
jgi:RNA polymerase sigma factor (sigma-70 family)